MLVEDHASLSEINHQQRNQDNQGSMINSKTTLWTLFSFYFSWPNPWWSLGDAGEKWLQVTAERSRFLEPILWGFREALGGSFMLAAEMQLKCNRVKWGWGCVTPFRLLWIRPVQALLLRVVQVTNSKQLAGLEIGFIFNFCPTFQLDAKLTRL